MNTEDQDSMIDTADIRQMAQMAGLTDFAGRYRELGGGEVNDTFLLYRDSEDVVLRVAKYPGESKLSQEARALALLDLPVVPKLLYFDEKQTVKGRAWIIESYLKGTQPGRLSLAQYESLGKLLAKTHRVKSSSEVKVDFWSSLLTACKSFGNEADFLSHPDEHLRDIIVRAKKYFAERTAQFDPIAESLTHGDATPSNMLVNGDVVSLIDWEFSTYKDAMADFSTIYYDDMEYNRGKWRVCIDEEQKAALFEGYTKAGGMVDEERLAVWMNLDKLGAALFLYWRVHQAGRTDSTEQTAQYTLDLANLTASLDRNIPS